MNKEKLWHSQAVRFNGFTQMFLHSVFFSPLLVVAHVVLVCRERLSFLTLCSICHIYSYDQNSYPEVVWLYHVSALCETVVSDMSQEATY